MPIFRLFSKRQRESRGQVPDVFRYDEIPQPLRVQIVHIINDALGANSYDRHWKTDALAFLHDALAREYGVFSLMPGQNKSEGFLNFLLSVDDCEKALDAIELAIRYVDK